MRARASQAADLRMRAARRQQELLLRCVANTAAVISAPTATRQPRLYAGLQLPALALMAYVPGSREQVNGGVYITRPRFVGISEFIPTR